MMNIAKYLTCVFLIVFFNPGIAVSQEGYNILYINQNRYKDSKFLPKTYSYTRLVFNDKFIFSYSFTEGSKDPVTDNKYPSKKTTGLLRQRNLPYLFFNVEGKKSWFRDSMRTKSYDWVFSLEEKVIAGYQCKKAYFINEYFLPTTDSIKTWKTDSIVVWFTEQIKPATNHFYTYSGIPGTVLEIHDQIKTNWYCRAIAVNKEQVHIEFPNEDLIKRSKFSKHPKW